MSTRLITDTCTAGALIRRQVRVVLDLEGVKWREHKGLAESTFVVSGTHDQWVRIDRHFKRIVGER